MSFHPTILAIGRFDAEGRIFSILKDNNQLQFFRSFDPTPGKAFIIPIGSIEVSSTASAIEQLIGSDSDDPTANFSDPALTCKNRLAIEEELETHHDADLAPTILALAEAGVRLTMIP